MQLNIRLNTEAAAVSASTLKDAAQRKKAATETLDEAWTRLSALKYTDKERVLFDEARRAHSDGKIGRLKTGKFTKGEALEMGRIVAAKNADQLREQRIRETIDNKPPNYFILTDDSELPRFIERVREECRLQRKEWANRFEVLGVESMTAGDFEGTGIDAYIDLTIGFSIWLPLLDEGYYLAYGHVAGFDVPYAFQPGDKQLTRSKVIEAISPYLSSPSEGKTFHMGAARYDMHVAENDGYSLRGVIWDTLDAMNLMNEHEESYGLKPLTQKYGKHYGISGAVYSFDDLFGNRSPAPFNTLLVGIYAINDVKYGWKLFEWQFELMAKTGRLLECYAAVDKDLPETDVFLERSGFRLNFDLLRELEVEYTAKVADAEKRVFEAYKIDADFIRKMDRTINANKIAKWQTEQQRRIDRKQAQLDAKQTKVDELKRLKKTTTKMFGTESEALAKYKRELAELAAPTIENAPQEVTEFSITNGNHIGYLIYDHLGIADKTYLVDKSKKRSTAADVLDYYYQDEPTLEPLATVAEYTKLLTTYIRPMLGIGQEYSTVEVDGRLHSNFKAGGTNTGRYSSSSYSGRPTDIIDVATVNDSNYLSVVKALIADNRKIKRGTNLQNIPARGDGVRVRNAFIPRDGFIFVGSDLGQIEPRIQAHIMYTRYGDNSMRQIFIDGVDLYTTMAMKVFGLAEEYCVDKAYDPTGKFKPRSLIKTGVLAKSYGQTPEAFARNMNVSIEVAEIFFRNFDEQFPSFTKMVTDIREGMKRTSYVETLYGRKRRFPEYKTVAAEVKKNEGRLMQYYIERKRLNGKKTKSPKDKERLAELAKLITPLADKRGLVAYWERAAFNAVIQGTGADILKMNGNRLARICRERGWEFNASIHDEIKISVPKTELTPEVIALVKDVMTNTVELSVPLVTDTVIEPRWMEEYAPEEWFAKQNEEETK